MSIRTIMYIMKMLKKSKESLKFAAQRKTNSFFCLIKSF